jgi:DNA repair exonuclease SbcCD ATPase subunit
MGGSVVFGEGILWKWRCVMENAAAMGSGNNPGCTTDSERAAKLRDRLERLLQEAAAVEVELSRADGTIKGVPHYSVIEGRAHELGKELSRQVQQRQMNELAACQAPMAKCPACGTLCPLEPKWRRVSSVDGKTDLQELVGRCPCCRRDFFPST